MDFASLIQDVGVPVAILLAAFWLGIKRKWVFGWSYDEKVKECEQWKEIALRGTTLLTEAVTTVETIAPKKGGR